MLELVGEAPSPAHPLEHAATGEAIAALLNQLNANQRTTPDGSPSYEIIIGNSYEHYSTHHQSIRK